MYGPRTCDVSPAGGSSRLSAPRTPEPPQRAPFNAPSLAPLAPAPDGPQAPSPGSGWSGALVPQHKPTSRNRYYVKLAWVRGLVLCVRTGALGFLQADPQKHVSSQPRQFSGSVENAPDTLSDSGSSQKQGQVGRRHTARSLQAREARRPACLSIPGSGAFFASPARVSSEGDFLLSGVE